MTHTLYTGSEFTMPSLYVDAHPTHQVFKDKVQLVNGHGGLVIHFSNPPRNALVTGADLRALRDFVNSLEIPEGDLELHGTGVVDEDGDWWLYNGHTDCWYLAGSANVVSDAMLEPDAQPNRRKGFEYVEEIINVHGIKGEPTPEWIDGDRIEYRGTSFDSTYVRSDGNWTRTRFTRGRAPKVTHHPYNDRHMSELVESRDRYRVVVKGGIAQ